MTDTDAPRHAPNHEMRLVAAFFGDIKGYFVEVGANDPHSRSQTWHLTPEAVIEVPIRSMSKVTKSKCSAASMWRAGSRG